MTSRFKKENFGKKGGVMEKTPKPLRRRKAMGTSRKENDEKTKEQKKPRKDKEANTTNDKLGREERTIRNQLILLRKPSKPVSKLNISLQSR